MPWTPESSQDCWTMRGASKAVLILATIRDYYTVVLADSIEREITRAEAGRAALRGQAETTNVASSMTGWLERVKIERPPIPTHDEIGRQSWSLLPVVRHSNDVSSVVTAIQAKPAWVISTNQDHWNDAVAQRAGLRITTPWGFLQQLSANFANRSYFGQFT